MTIAPIDKNAVSVISMLEQAKTWLASAVDVTGPEDIAAAKAQIRTAEVYARELGLSREIQDDAAEMVRRAEYALGKAIRKGQAEGTVRRHGDQQDRHGDDLHGKKIVSVPELIGIGGLTITETYALSDGVEPEQFETALEMARDEGNLSRANVVRKIKGQTSQQMNRQQRADLIDELAAQGYSSRQMPTKVGVSEETVRQIARDFDIAIPADRSIARTRRVNSTQVVVNTATALEGLVMGIELVDFDALDPAEAGQWTDSLTESIRKLRRFNEQVRKAVQ